MSATGCEFDVTPEVKASTDRILEACDKLDERRENVLNMLQQCMHKDVDSSALALHHTLKAYRDGVLPLASALPLAKLYMMCARLDVERLELAEHKKASEDAKALMAICTAPFTKD